MRRYLIFGSIAGTLLLSGIGLYFINNYRIHRYDDLIRRQAGIYHLDADLVWSVIYEETYFRSWKRGAAEEIGLMQVRPVVAREWAKETGMREFARQVDEDLDSLLLDPEKNIQIGSWYLEKVGEQYRGFPAETAMTLAAYNAGSSRVEEWTKTDEQATLSEQNFIDRISIPSTKSYVTSILARYKQEKTKKK
ncbi:MAG: transglycosylase SLT domain-containing protein [Pyrinomonadaceae bacterium]